MTLYMIQLLLDPLAFVRFLQSQGLNRKEDEDLGYGIHAWLAAAFGDLAPRPFRLYMGAKDHRPPKVLGYASQPHTILVDKAKSFAEPFTLSVCDFDHYIDSRKMTTDWSRGTRLGFEVLTCPVGRKAQSHIEKDIFLIHAERLGSDAGLSRELVYREWLEKQLESVCELEYADLKSFRLVHQTRRSQASKDANRQKLARLTRPQVLLAGTLKVEDGVALSQIVSKGIGRHKAFGYGMLLLRPI
jgi:CRISPR system Cascade subunit CasE